MGSVKSINLSYQKNQAAKGQGFRIMYKRRNFRQLPLNRESFDDTR
jgi:hypothetical protein